MAKVLFNIYSPWGFTNPIDTNVRYYRIQHFYKSLRLLGTAFHVQLQLHTRMTSTINGDMSPPLTNQIL